MSSTFKLPDPGEGIHEAEIVTLNVEPNDEVEESEVLMEVETDKALVEIPSPFTGRVTDVLVEVGERVEVGAPLLKYETNGAEGAAQEETAPDGDEDKGTESSQPEARGEEAEAGGASEKDRDGPEEGESGSSTTARGEEPRRGSGARERPVPAAPATRRLARELGVELRSVEGSGPAGRVTPEDVRRAAERGADEEDAERAREAERREAARTPEEAPDDEVSHDERPAEDEQQKETQKAEPSDVVSQAEAWGDVKWEPLRSVRRTTAERMSRSWASAPHVTHLDHADITDLERLRERHAAAVEEAGGTLTLTVFVLKALVAVLKEFPRFNAHFDEEGERLGLLDYYDVGLAVDTDRGLLVPVLRDVDARSLTDLAVDLRELSERARQGELTRQDMRGGSFTVTNPGPLGGDAFTPIINPPQVAILGTARASWEPVVREEDGERVVVPRYRLPLCLAFDHRVNDGADAARFVTRLVEILEDPDSFVRHL